VVRGDLIALRSAAGDYTAAIDQCAADDQAATFLDILEAPAPDGALFFLVRPVNCGGPGSYDSGAPSQVAPRDPAIEAAGPACP